MISSFLSSRARKFPEANEKNASSFIKDKVLFIFEVNSNNKYLSSCEVPKRSCKCGTNFQTRSKAHFIKLWTHHLWSITEGEQDLGKADHIICSNGNVMRINTDDPRQMFCLLSTVDLFDYLHWKAKCIHLSCYLICRV